MAERIRVAVDAMGTDLGPGTVVQGALDALASSDDGLSVVLVGDEAEINRHLPRDVLNTGRCEVLHCRDSIGMAESVPGAYRSRRDSSIVVATRLLAERKVDAFVSAGNTSAVVTASLLGLGRLKGVLRPALGSIVPTPTGNVVLLDVGATSGVKPVHLLQFALMGKVYARYVLGVSEPKVGLLNIGEESSKGSEVYRQAFRMMDDVRDSLNFVGNVEGRDILRGTTEVVVTDGFTGNVLLKFAESVVGMVVEVTRREMASNLKYRIGALMLRPLLYRLRNRLNYEEYGGVPLLGVNGIVVIAHGRSTPKAIMNAVLAARHSAVERIDVKIREELTRESRGEDAVD